ncbi:SGNH/GDSL hydrolase family protein [Segatella sp.]|mgnify:CR=1 FL=1|uniref:SGNH/GDSL hydrolase family protein n=1 Tax=Segatella sp. TaxID=2974253 RepID=UPI003080DE58
MKRFTFIISFIMLTFMPLMAQVKQTVAVLGDSYSTFEGFIPKGYATWYSPTTPPETTDVNKVEQTWWWQVISVKKICNKYQVPVIALHDIDKKNGHPTIKGMKSIADQVLMVIKK